MGWLSTFVDRDGSCATHRDVGVAFCWHSFEGTVPQLRRATGNLSPLLSI